MTPESTMMKGDAREQRGGGRRKGPEKWGKEDEEGARWRRRNETTRKSGKMSKGRNEQKEDRRYKKETEE